MNKAAAIRARINGVFDDPDLMRLGPLGSVQEDILRILDQEEPAKQEETTIPSNEWALVTTDNCTALQLLIPDGRDEDTLTNVAMYLTACFARAYKEPDFAAQMVDWLQAQKPEELP